MSDELTPPRRAYSRHVNRRELADALETGVVSADPIGGGDINDAFRVRLADGRTIFVKSHANAPPGMFAAEARGLDWLREANAIRIPSVLATGESWLALEWLDLAGRPDPAALGRALATLHRAGAPSFGFDAPNYLATLPQDNTVERDWPTFYVERRLRPLCTRAGLGVDRQLDSLRAQRDAFGPAEPPARLHGDLWWGNVASCGSDPVIIDPAVYGGHREIDLAMLALFGGVPDRLVEAYEDVYPLADGWRERVLLYQLYPLAAHACLFGGGYGAQVIRALARY
ncbi:MAG: phosphotransferase [Kofleriaceae bacterium]|nr:phosphotransferase [Kofleriaceae bacterium]